MPPSQCINIKLCVGHDGSINAMELLDGEFFELSLARTKVFCIGETPTEALAKIQNLMEERWGEIYSS